MKQQHVTSVRHFIRARPFTDPHYPPTEVVLQYLLTNDVTGESRWIDAETVDGSKEIEKPLDTADALKVK